MEKTHLSPTPHEVKLPISFNIPSAPTFSPTVINLRSVRSNFLALDTVDASTKTSGDHALKTLYVADLTINSGLNYLLTLVGCLPSTGLPVLLSPYHRARV